MLLLTGATGFLGGEVLARLLERDEGPVCVLVRASDDTRARRRVDETIASLMGSAEPWSERTVAVAADFEQPALGLDVARHDWLAERVDRIVHCAASVSFTLGLEESRAINVEGTRRLLDLAELCSRRGDGLDCFTHVSTCYVAGTTAGTFGELELDRGQGFRNAYERSKFEAELLVRERAGSLPLQVVRPSIVVGDSRTGWTPAFNVLYQPLRAFARGAYPALPARRSAPVDVVPVDYVADAIVALAGRPGGTYHLSGGENATSVAEIVELASAHLAQRPPPTLPPWLYRRAIHPLLVRSGSKSRRRALRRSEVFFPYFSLDVRYDAAAARTALAPLGIDPPPLGDYFDRLMGYALAADWGRRSLPRNGAPATVGSPRPQRAPEKRLRPTVAGSLELS